MRLISCLSLRPECRESRIIVTCNFSQPGQPMQVVLPQSYSSGSAVRISTEVKVRRPERLRYFQRSRLGPPAGGRAAV
jgi:hypothetical protein